jgi:hypothetical protein
MMAKPIKFFFIYVILSYFATPVFADTILLKSGKVAEGELLEKTDKYLKINAQGLPITYFSDEIESVNGIRLLQVNKIKENDQINNNLIKKQNSQLSSDNNTEIIKKRIEDYAYTFWSYRESKRALKFSSKYGDLAFHLFGTTTSFLLTICIVVLFTYFLFKFIKFSVPFPVILVFGLLVWPIEDTAYIYFLMRNTDNLISSLMSKFSYSQDVVQSLMATRINALAIFPLEKLRIHLVLAFVFYFTGGIYLLTLHKPARITAFILLLYWFFATLRNCVGLPIPGIVGTLFAPALAIVVACYCLDEQYFYD